jgi:hypothetical protein
MTRDNLKELIGTKFLFDDNLISYENLVKLLENKGLNTDFIQKPIKDKLEVHSLYIKPDFEVAFLGKSKVADEYYKDAGYSCINYKEIELYDVLKLLGYYDILQSYKDVQEEKSPKKSKFLTFNYDGNIFSYNKKHIIRLRYYQNSELYIDTKEIEHNQFKFTDITTDEYNIIMSQL